MKKKLLMLLLAGCVIFGMTACGTEKEAEKETEQNTEESTETENDALGSSKVKELGEYMGLTYTPLDTTATEAEVDEYVQNLLANNANKESVEVVTETSYVNIDYVGTKDGVAFDGGTAENQELSIENSNYIDGFAESIVGMKVGETKDCPMTFPEEYHAEDLAGQDVVFTITVNEAWEEVPAELNDEFAVGLGYESLDALYEEIKKEIETEKESELEADMEYQLIQAAIDNSTFDMDEEEIELYIQDVKSEQEYYAQMYGVDLETYITAFGVTMDEFEEQCREIAIYRIQSPLVLTAIAEKEGIEMTDEEYQTRAEEYMNYYGYDTVEALEEAYTKETVSSQVYSDMALELLVANAVAE